MNIAFVLVALSTIWLNSCVIAQKKIAHQDDFFNTWSPIVHYLNQDGSEHAGNGDDLISIYDHEMAHLAARAREQGSDRKETNVLFHNEITKQNRLVIDALKMPAHSRDDVAKIAADVLHAIESHPIASSKNTRAYDGGSQIGFCFGRAMLAHYLLLKAGLSQNSLAKVFALGDFYVGAEFWRFHVAMMIKTSDGFLMVDPLYGELVYLDAWMENVGLLDVKKPLSRARFFVTDPRKFMPSTGMYDVSLLTPPEIKPYFYDLGKSLLNSEMVSRARHDALPAI